MTKTPKILRALPKERGYKNNLRPLHSFEVGGGYLIHIFWDKNWGEFLVYYGSISNCIRTPIYAPTRRQLFARLRGRILGLENPVYREVKTRIARPSESAVLEMPGWSDE